MGKEAVQKWIKKDSKLECYEVISDNDIKSCVFCGSEEAKNFEKYSESDGENLLTHPKLSHYNALVHTEALHNYFKQEDESTSAQGIMVRNLSSNISGRINEKLKETFIISFFTKW